ncbi:TIGR03619 family F420-dependent LLM class oxidoreductase [Streptomyces heilongjiangensis]|uniref:TIGR03619 family F420-dependent LLM class oxidoreductase n=1 Tax=Streptomyces heilongjiangensis TaxID=945052 RepID=A0ABW1BIQ6_9ACTN|nr:TIGR03619 family F420-dependent LLM class oxidoreductase [Streptomyces heilongjiangensis]MDC2952220.1 TIGR03619 family F420-dependent LLM class oxidoreductase [Streptomyces heilongjiangensis]
MRIGFAVPMSGSWATPDIAVHVARSAEQLGYDSLWTYQRVLGTADDSWGEANRSVHDPLVTLSFLAAHTTRIRLGVAVLIMPLHTPAVLAKQLTTLDLLSGGRLDVGLGNGWAAEEYAAAGVPTTDLGRRAEDFLACLRALWTEKTVEHDGPFYRVPPSRFDPKPAQFPHPPLLLGGSASAALRRAGRLCDGWIASSKATPTAIRDAIAVVRNSAERAGRDPAALRFVCRAPVRLRSRPDTDQPLLTGTADKLRADLAVLAGTGLTEIFVDPNFDPEIGSPDASADDVTSRVDLLLRELAPGHW